MKHRTIKISLAFAATTALILVAMNPAGAGATLGAIFDAVQTSITRATQARDRATEARNNAGSARDRAIESRDNAQEILDAVREGRLVLSSRGPVTDAIGGAIEDLSRILAEETAGLEEFTGSEDCAALCPGFRLQLTSMISNMESLSNAIGNLALLGFPGLTLNLDFQPVVTTVESMPGRVLYPVYRVLERDNNLIGTVGTVLTETAMTLTVLEQGLNPALAGRGMDESCAAVLENRETFESAAALATFAGVYFRMIGETIHAAGTTSLQPGVGLHGYPQVLVKTDFPTKLGHFLNGLSGGLFSISTYASGKLRYCTILDNHQQTQNLIVKSYADLVSRIDPIVPPADLLAD